MYVYALGQLVDKADVDIAVSSCTCPKSIWPQCTQQFARFPAGGENFAFVQVSL
jgi:hypothetical protein